MRKNLFIVNTPFHLLTSFILQKARGATKNYLALVHPHGYARWAENPALSYMASSACGYADVFLLLHFMSSRHKEKPYREQVREVRRTIGALGVDDIYLGSDIDPQNQLLAASLGKTDFYRYEDGLYSYYNENRRRSFTHKWFHKLKIKALEIGSGISTELFINTSTASDSRAGKGDFLYYPALLKRYSPRAQEITAVMIEEALRDLKAKGLLAAELPQRSVLYLSQPLVEQKKITLEEEYALLQNAAFALSDRYNFFYKPHPNDSADKWEFYRRKLPQIKPYRSLKPAELSFASEANLAAVISYQSTALMTAQKFSRGRVKALSLAHFYRGTPLHPAYVEILQNAGVLFLRDREKIGAEILLELDREGAKNGEKI